MTLLKKKDVKFKEQCSTIIKRCPKSRNTVRELIAYCDNQNIIFPSYPRLQDLYTKAFQDELQQISKIIITFPRELNEKVKKV